MRSISALLAAVLLAVLTPSQAAAASSDAYYAAGSGTDAITDITGYYLPDTSGATFVPVDPVRLLDTRSGNGLSGMFASGIVRQVQIAGRGGIPAEAIAVTMNITVTQQTSSGFVSVGPTMSADPTTSTINVPRADTRANGATVALSGDGRLAAVWKGASGSRTHLVFDITGYYLPDTSGATFVPVDPVRLLDTRSGNGLSGMFASGIVRQVQIAGRGGIPAEAIAVTMNITVTQQTSSGFVSVGPTMSADPTTSTINVPRADTRANGATVALSGDGRLAAVWKGASGSRTHLVFDITGYYLPDTSGATFVPVDPVRLLDTRSGNGLSGMFASGIVRQVQIAGRGGIPAEAIAVTMNITVTQQTSSGFVSVGPTMSADPTTSTINVPRADTRANGATVALSGDGRLAAVWKGQRAPRYPSYESRYHDSWELLVAIRDAEIAYPDIVDVFVAGYSYEGRPIWAAKVSDNVHEDEDEPEVLFDALHHAREHLTIEQNLDMFLQLSTRYGSNSTITNLVNQREVWFIFALNPDGWAFDLGGSPYLGWRKNRQPTPGSGHIGTDPNRNYAYKWGCCGGSSSWPGAWNYRGPAPWSTPEVRVLRDFVNSRVIDGEQQIRTHVTLHTNGELILYPPGYTFTDVPSGMSLDDHRTFVAMGRAMANRNGFTAQQSSQLYPTDGDQIDWMYFVHDIFSFTFELYPTETVAKPTDHEPPDEVIATQNARNRSALLYLIDLADCPYEAISKPSLC